MGIVVLFLCYEFLVIFFFCSSISFAFFQFLETARLKLRKEEISLVTATGL